eukprot:Rhum_TRINITY_DN14788_c12_g1::Rhum_TRINITY_DN14788_c12_g1_i2::g.119109::m.119109
MKGKKTKWLCVCVCVCVCACLFFFFFFFYNIASVFIAFALPSYILTATQKSYRKEHRAKVGASGHANESDASDNHCYPLQHPCDCEVTRSGCEKWQSLLAGLETGRVSTLLLLAV